MTTIVIATRIMIATATATSWFALEDAPATSPGHLLYVEISCSNWLVGSIVPTSL